MPTNRQHIHCILSEAPEPLFPSEIANQLNHELGVAPAYTSAEVIRLLFAMSEVTQRPDGRWTLK